MNVLAFDTCLGALSVAVCRARNGSPDVREVCELRTAGHAERLLPMIGEVMRDAGVAFAEIDRIAVTVGPGSFTGVRVGIAAARALALAMGRPVVGMSSLAAMAFRADELLGNARAGRPLVVAVDARRGTAYVQAFGADLADTLGPRLADLGAPPAVDGDGPVVVVGSAARAVEAALVAAGREVEVLLEDLQPHARTLALLAPSLAPAAPLAPLYLRPPDVKPQGDKSLLRAVP